MAASGHGGGQWCYGGGVRDLLPSGLRVRLDEI